MPNRLGLLMAQINRNKPKKVLLQHAACFTKRGAVPLVWLACLLMPSESEASGLSMLHFSYFVVCLSEMAPLLFLCSKRMAGRALVASMAYLLFVGALWRYVVLAPPVDYALKFSEAEWLSRTLGRKRDYLLAELGAEHGQTVFDVTTFYIPLLLPPLIAWGIYSLLKSKEKQ